MNLLRTVFRSFQDPSWTGRLLKPEAAFHGQLEVGIHEDAIGYCRVFRVFTGLTSVLSGCIRAQPRFVKAFRIGVPFWSPDFMHGGFVS